VSSCPGPRLRLTAVVHGIVQGVGFRWFVQREAAGLGLTGWTANLADGSVEVVAEGSPPELARLEEMLRAGPAGASVSRVAVYREAARGDLADFVIRSGAHRGD
jgi:acylphosphatase